jgi:hypothetical protein
MIAGERGKIHARVSEKKRTSSFSCTKVTSTGRFVSSRLICPLT